MEYTVTTFYKFTPLEASALPALQRLLEAEGERLGLLGLTLLAPEGINATISGSAAGIEEYKQFLLNQFGDMLFKDSPSDKKPFKRFKVKIKQEIVQLKRTDVLPTGSEEHISPEAWDKALQEEDRVVIDVRNWYETRLGTFKKAIDPGLKHFSQFPGWIKKADIPKNKKISIFCTGGIRCEKAAVALKEQGYEHVQQLDGGILNYLAQKPNNSFEGQCFVFDQRVAVDQELKPSQTHAICPHCGNPGATKSTCMHCDKNYQACDECLAKLPASLCSKRCRNEYSLDKEKSPHSIAVGA
jgi:UPF0176 protein